MKNQTVDTIILNTASATELKNKFDAACLGRLFILLIASVFLFPFLIVPILVFNLFPKVLCWIFIITFFLWLIPTYFKFAAYYCSRRWELRTLSPAEVATIESKLGKDFFN